ncbi:MAG: hypothetical protein KF774_13080 [Planctomyces sp.]|nr:hypothetical protein [Planctomyces sp.]
MKSVAVLAMAGLAGCTSAQTSNTARTATEQLLLSNAVDQTLDKVDFRPFSGQAVYLEEKYMDCVDKQYVIASIRHRILRAGGQLVDKVDDAAIVLEPRSGGVGTTSSSSFLGFPEVVLPGMLTLPEIRMFTRTRQSGFAKIGMAAYDAKSHETLGAGGVSVAQSDDSNYYVVGIGPFQSGSLKKEIERTTTGPAGVTKDRLPPQVVFSAKPRPLPLEEDAVHQAVESHPEGAAATVRPSPYYAPPQ